MLALIRLLFGLQICNFIHKLYWFLIATTVKELLITNVHWKTRYFVRLISIKRLFGNMIVLSYSYWRISMKLSIVVITEFLELPLKISFGVCTRIAHWDIIIVLLAWRCLVRKKNMLLFLLCRKNIIKIMTQEFPISSCTRQKLMMMHHYPLLSARIEWNTRH